MRCFAFCLLVLSTSLAGANENWPQFRGPQGNGHSDSSKLPVTWSETENVVWKTPIHNRGWSSPVVWGDQVWLTTATADGRQMFAVAIDRQNGKIIHDLKVFDNETLDPIAAVNSYASPSSAIEEGRVYVHFGTYGTACLDTHTGRVLWTRRDLKCDHHEGAGSSPILVDNLLIFNVDGRDVQYVIALDKASGATAWKTDRSVDYTPHDRNLRKAFCTPIVVEVLGRRQLVSPGAKAMMGYDLATGEELWRIQYDGWSMTPRPLFANGLVYFINDYLKPELVALRLGRKGELGDSDVAWKISKGMPSRPSPLLVGESLFMVNSDGIVTCADSKTGEMMWKNRIGGNFSASPIAADGRLYLFDEGSTTTVIEPAGELKVLAVNKLSDEESLASPAVAGQSLFIRTKGYLYRIENHKVIE